LLAAYELSPLTHWRVLLVAWPRLRLSLYARWEGVLHTIPLVHSALDGISSVTSTGATIPITTIVSRSSDGCQTTRCRRCTRSSTATEPAPGIDDDARHRHRAAVGAVGG
jgi:hypothetical protein